MRRIDAPSKHPGVGNSREYHPMVRCRYALVTRIAIALAAALFFVVTVGKPTSARAMSQSCLGTLQIDGSVVLLQPDASSKSPWCSANIGEDLSSPLAKSVLRKCPIGSTCRIAGDFTGHGVFYWTTLKSVSLVKVALPSADDLVKQCDTTTSSAAAAKSCLMLLDGAYGLFLTETYQDLRSRLSGKARKTLVDEQTKWLAERSGTCGTLDTNAKASCIVRTTVERISVLMARR
jgi:uncharacterized protein YecT (DUF1311 family)